MGRCVVPVCNRPGIFHDLFYGGIIPLGHNVGNDIYSANDAEIIRQVLDGNVNAFEYLVKRYKNLVQAIVTKHVPYEHVEDTMQDVFLRTYRSLTNFKSGDGFKPWLSVITARTCYDFWREQYKSKELPMSSLSEQHQAWLENALSEQSSRLFDEKGAQREAREILDRALANLSPGDRMAVELVYFEGHSTKEAAQLLGWSNANVKVRLFRSRKKLSAFFEAGNLFSSPVRGQAPLRGQAPIRGQAHDE
jgi:RNA polymerase sigma-70 factor, ECF subfamily